MNVRNQIAQNHSKKGDERNKAPELWIARLFSYELASRANSWLCYVLLGFWEPRPRGPDGTEWTWEIWFHNHMMAVSLRFTFI